jgi:WD40 repeat protein
VRTGEGADDPPLTELNPLLFSPDGRFACATAGVSREGVDGLRFSRTTADGRWAEVWRKEFPRNEYLGWAFRVLMFSSDSAKLARVFQRGPYRRVTEMCAEVLAAESGDFVARWEGALPIDAREGSVSPTGVIVLLHTRAFYALDAADPNAKPVKRLNASSKHFTSAAFSLDGSRLATTSNDTAATIWNASTWEVQRRYAWDIGRLRVVCFAPDGLRCAAASDTGQIVVWDLDE